MADSALERLRRLREIGEETGTSSPALQRLRTIRSDASEDNRQRQGIIGLLTDAVKSLGGGFNQALAETVGIPIDASNFVLRQLGVPIERVGVTDALKRGAEKARVQIGPVDDSLVNRMSAGAGVGLAAAIPAAGGPAAAASRAGTRSVLATRTPQSALPVSVVDRITGNIAAPAAGQGRISRLAAPFVESARLAPGRTSAIESLGGAAAGAGGVVGAETGIPGGEAIGTMVGSIAAPGMLATNLLESPAVIKQGLRGAFPRSREEIAAAVLQRSTSNVDDALRNLGKDTPQIPGFKLTSPQRAADPGLLSLQRGIEAMDARIQGRLLDISGEQNTAIRAEIKAAANATDETTIEALQQFQQGRVDKFLEMLDLRTSQALTAARQRRAAAQPTLPREEVNRVAREELELAMREARATENELWQLVHRERDVNTRPLKEAVATLQASRRKADAAGDLPQDLMKVIAGGEDTVEIGGGGNLAADAQAFMAGRPRQGNTGFGDVETVDEILALRSRVLQEKREAVSAAAPNRRLIGALDDIGDAALTALSQGDTADIDAARAVSRAVNDKFTRGPIGKLLGFDVTGGGRTPDILTLEKLLATGGPAGGVNTDALLQAFVPVDATGTPEELLELAQSRISRTARNFLLDRFYEGAVDIDGKVNTNALGTFLRRTKPVLDRFPEIKRELTDVFKAQKLADRVARTESGLRKNLTNTRTSRAALMLSVEPEKIVAQALQQKQPAETLKAFLTTAKKDPTGQAVSGLRQGFFDYMLDAVELKSAVDLRTGKPVLNPRSFSKFISTNKRAMTQSGLFSKQQMQRFNTVGEALDAVERSVKSPSRTVGSDTVQKGTVLFNFLESVVAGKLGAEAGAAVGASPLVTAGAAKQMLRKIVAKTFDVDEAMRSLILEAIENPDVMRTLLMREFEVAPETFAPVVLRRLRGHLIGLNIPMVPPTEEEHANALKVDLIGPRNGGQSRDIDTLRSIIQRAGPGQTPTTPAPIPGGVRTLEAQPAP